MLLPLLLLPLDVLPIPEVPPVPVLPLVPVPVPLVLPLPVPVPLPVLLPVPELPDGQSVFDWARESLPVPLRDELPAVDPELPEPRFAELEPAEGLCESPDVPSGQSTEEELREPPLLSVAPLRPELVPAPLPLEELPEPTEPDPLPVVPLGALRPEEPVPLEDPPLVCDQPG